MTQHILLIDDNAFNREGIRLYLSGKGFTVQETGDEASAWELAQKQHFDVAIVDISIPPNSQTQPRSEFSFGIRLAQKFKEHMPSMGVVLFSAYEDRGAEVLNMIRDGVRGIAYKLKGSHPDSLLQAIHDVISGRVVIDPDVHANGSLLADQLFERLMTEEKSRIQFALAVFEDLTPREKEIAQRVAASHNTHSIAQALTITPKTVENYISRIYDKLGFGDSTTENAGLRKAVLLAKVCMIYELRSQ